MDMKGLKSQSRWLRVDLMGNGEPWVVFEQERSPHFNGFVLKHTGAFWGDVDFGGDVENVCTDDWLDVGFQAAVEERKRGEGVSRASLTSESWGQGRRSKLKGLEMRRP